MSGLVRGWCPSLLHPMESGDGWLVRIRPREGVLTGAVLRTVAEAALHYGNGLIEITNRANLQIRGLTPLTIAPFTEAMGVTDPADERRNILVSPLLGADPAIASETLGIARAIAEGLADEAFANLPGKFGFLIDGGGVLPLTGMRLDVTLRALNGRWLLQGQEVFAEAAAEQALALARSPTHTTPIRPATVPLLGFHSYGDEGVLLFTPAFGQVRAETLAALAGLAARYGDGALRPTPWKSFAVAGVTQVDRLRFALGDLGLMTDPHDPRLGIVTCVGAPGCLRGEVETHVAASSLADVRRAGDPLWHLSGCRKGCAHPGPAAVTLVGNYRRLNLVRDGKAGDIPDLRALTLAETLKLMQSVPA